MKRITCFCCIILFAALFFHSGIAVQAEDIYTEEDAAKDFKKYGNSISFLWGELLSKGSLQIDEGGKMILSDDALMNSETRPIIQYMVNKLNESVDLGILNLSHVGGKIIVSASETAKVFENKFKSMVVESHVRAGKKMQFDISRNSSERISKDETASVQSSEEHSCDCLQIDLMQICHEDYLEIENIKNVNYQLFANSLDADPLLTTIFYWVSKVREGGEWDYKTVSPYDKGLLCSYYDGAYHHFNGEYMGNYVYGYTGRAVIALDALHNGSFAVEMFASTDYSDWGAIDAGFYQAGRVEKNPGLNVSLSWKNVVTSIYEGTEDVWSVDVWPNDSTVSWSSSNENVATVSGGHVRGINPGTATITASANGLTISQTVTIRETSLQWKATTTSIYQGEQCYWTVNAVPSTLPYWQSSDSSVASVNNSGGIFGNNPGTAVISVTANGKTLSKKIEVKENSITSSVTEYTLYSGREYLWKINATPGCKAITYKSSNENVATVDSNGLIKSMNKGSATITASANNVSASIRIIVINPELSWTTSVGTMYVGKNYFIRAESVPSSMIAYSSSNPTIASIGSNSGNITPISPGKVSFYATAEAFSDKFSILLNAEVVMPDLSWGQTSTTLLYCGQKSQTTNWSVRVNPTGYLVSWSSSNPSVASVNSGGLIMANQPGTCTIYASIANGAVTVSKNLTVEAAKFVSASTSRILFIGEGAAWSVSRLPSNEPVTFSSSRPSVATVDANGNISAKSAGTAIITAKLPNGKTITNSIVVKNKLLTWSSSTSSIKKGQKAVFKAVTSPSATIVYSSSNSSVAAVDSKTGTVTARKKGTATIYAQANGLIIAQSVTVY